MLSIVVLVVIAVLVVLAVVVAMQPADFRIERSASIAAPPQAVFPHVNDVHRFQEWSPWAKRDPAMKMSFQGPPAGEGAGVHWSGNKEVGEGSMTVTDSRADELVRYQLEFIKPFKASNVAEFSFQPDRNGTTLTWSMTGRNNFFAKAFGLVMSMDKLVGGDFEQGLASLKALVEGG